jgi:hypothetical protein
MAKNQMYPSIILGEVPKTKTSAKQKSSSANDAPVHSKSAQQAASGKPTTPRRRGK